MVKKTDLCGDDVSTPQWEALRSEIDDHTALIMAYLQDADPVDARRRVQMAVATQRLGSGGATCTRDVLFQAIFRDFDTNGYIRAAGKRSLAHGASKAASHGITQPCVPNAHYAALARRLLLNDFRWASAQQLDAALAAHGGWYFEAYVAVSRELARMQGLQRGACAATRPGQMVTTATEQTSGKRPHGDAGAGGSNDGVPDWAAPMGLVKISHGRKAKHIDVSQCPPLRYDRCCVRQWRGYQGAPGASRHDHKQGDGRSDGSISTNRASSFAKLGLAPPGLPQVPEGALVGRAAPRQSRAGVSCHGLVENRAQNEPVDIRQGKQVSTGQVAGDDRRGGGRGGRSLPLQNAAVGAGWWRGVAQPPKPVEAPRLGMQRDLGKQPATQPAAPTPAARWQPAQVECGCCYSDQLIESMVRCQDGHMFCKACIKRYVEDVLFGTTRAEKGLPCMWTDGSCSACIPQPQLQRALPLALLERFEVRQVEDNLQQARLPGLTRCYACKLPVDLDEGVHVLHCPFCKARTCKACGEEAHHQLKCDEVETRQQLGARQTLEEEMTRKIVRECSSCKTKIVKEGGCNKVTCRCTAWTCYVCRQGIPKDVGYAHFCQHTVEPGQKCTQCQRCMLWQDNSREEEAELRRVHEERAQAIPGRVHARIEVPRRGPDLGVDLAGVIRWGVALIAGWLFCRPRN